MIAPSPTKLEVNELSSATYETTLFDDAGLPVPAGSLNELKATLYVRASGTKINGRNHQSVFNTNGGTFHPTSGLFTLELGAQDNIIEDPNRQREFHVLLLEAVWGGGSFNWEEHIYVNNLQQLPAP